VEEPIRGEGFSMILNGEVETLNAVIGEEDEDGQSYEGYEEGEDEFTGSMPSAMDDTEDILPAGGAMLLKNGLYAHGNLPSTGVNAHQIPRGPPRSHGGPVIAQVPSSVSFENPDIPSIYEPQVNFAGTPYIEHHPAVEQYNMKAWATNMYNNYEPQQQQQFHHLQVQRNFVNPPNASRSMGPSATTLGNHFGDEVVLATLKRHQQHSAMGYTADSEDTSSVGSVHSSKDRSGSFSPGSGFGSPTHASPMNYEIADTHTDYRVPKRLGLGGIHINSSIAGPWSDRGDAGMGGMVTKLGAPISVGGGGGYNMMI